MESLTLGTDREAWGKTIYIQRMKISPRYPCSERSIWTVSKLTILLLYYYITIITITIITIITLLYHYYQVKDISLCGAILQDCNVTLNPFQFRESSKAGQLMWCQQWDGKGSLLLDSLASKTKRNAFGKTINIQTTKQSLFQSYFCCQLQDISSSLFEWQESPSCHKSVWRSRFHLMVPVFETEIFSLTWLLMV